MRGPRPVPFSRSGRGGVTIDDVAARVAKQFRTSARAVLEAQPSGRKIGNARTAAIYLCHIALGLTKKNVAKAFGYGSHAAVSYVCSRAEDMRETDQAFDAFCDEIEQLCITRERWNAVRLVIVESPYAAEAAEDLAANIEYARRCVRDSLARGEAPIASHLLYTQPGILDDNVPSERQWGIDAGLAWRAVAEASVVYTDRGISRGMRYGIEAAESAGIPVEYRTIEA